MSNPDDTLAQQEVLADLHLAMAGQPRLRTAMEVISGQFSNGTLTLTGEVADIAQKRLTCRLARGVANVKTVKDVITVKPTEALGDGAVRDAALKHLLEEPVFRNCTVSVHFDDHDETVHQEGGDSPSGNILVGAKDGVVTLSGQVISLSHRRLAGVLAWWAPGCRNVENLVEVVPPEEDNDDELIDALMLVLEKDPFVHTEQLRVRAKAGTVTLYGFVRTDEARHMAEVDAWQLDGVKDVVNRIEVARI